MRRLCVFKLKASVRTVIPINKTYTHHSSHQEMQKVLSDVIEGNILKELQVSPFIFLLCDESINIAVLGGRTQFFGIQVLVNIICKPRTSGYPKLARCKVNEKGMYFVTAVLVVELHCRYHCHDNAWAINHPQIIGFLYFKKMHSLDFVHFFVSRKTHEILTW